MSSASKRLSNAEYLASERQALEKSEFYDGEVFAMGGGTANHSLLAANLARELGNQLAAGPCRVFNSDMRVRTPSGLYTYPDVSVVCVSPLFEDGNTLDVLLNPCVICEVLSPSTEAYDRGKKFAHYRTISSLMEYVLISQDKPVVEHYLRQPGADHWLFTAIVSDDSQLVLPTLDVSVSLRALYAKVGVAPP